MYAKLRKLHKADGKGSAQALIITADDQLCDINNHADCIINPHQVMFGDLDNNHMGVYKLNDDGTGYTLEPIGGDILFAGLLLAGGALASSNSSTVVAQSFQPTAVTSAPELNRSEPQPQANLPAPEREAPTLPAPSVHTSISVFDDKELFTGQLDNGDLTNDDTPTISGHTLPDISVLIQLDNGIPLHTTSDANGDWRITLPLITGQGDHTVTATPELNGVPSSFNFELDSIPPSISCVMGV